MSKTALGISLKSRTFLYGMVTAEFFPFRNVDLDAKVVALTELLREKTGTQEFRFTQSYADRLIYTQKMAFSWDKHDDVPQEITDVEIWWNMVINDEPEEECYMFYRKHIDWQFTNEYQKSLDSAHTIWKPKVESDSRDEVDADPNS